MSDLNKQCYQMPVLTEDEKNYLIEFVKVEMEQWSPDGNYYPLFAIALAALTVTPDCWEIAGTLFASEEEALKPGFIGTPEPLYSMPPVPSINQGGEQGC